MKTMEQDNRPSVADWRSNFPVGSRVTTKFYSRETERVRIVEEVFPSPVAGSQSTAWLKTTCGLCCDAAWFEIAEARAER